MSKFKLTVNGFTLLELLITLAIIGILAGISYPTYVEQLAQARRSEAIATLLGLQLELERQRGMQESFAQIAENMVVSPTEHYRFEMTDLGKNTYKLTANALDNQKQTTPCHQLTINHLSEKTPKKCWQ